MLGLRFSVVMPAGSIRMMRQRIEGYGFGPKLTSIRQVDRPVLELRQDIDATISHFSQQIRATADEGADAVVLGCMALFGLAARIDAPVPVIDPALAALSMAQSLVALRRR
jgi:allantoin racemase